MSSSLAQVSVTPSPTDSALASFSPQPTPSSDSEPMEPCALSVSTLNYVIPAVIAENLILIGTSVAVTWLTTYLCLKAKPASSAD